jgi:hypothetical protein
MKKESGEEGSEIRTNKGAASFNLLSGVSIQLFIRWQKFSLRAANITTAATAVAALCLCLCAPRAFAQEEQKKSSARNDQTATSHQDKVLAREAKARADAIRAEFEIVERAMCAVCNERASDPLGSVPIDVMQSHPPLPVTNPNAIAGLQRSERLLPIAKKLLIDVLYQLADEYKVEAWRVGRAAQRIEAVSRIEPDIDLRDNAAVMLNDPRTIRFGTIFLAGLPSDEGMISVLAHELTHLADGKADTLHSLFRQVGRRAANLTGIQITGFRTEELTCDMAGAMVVRRFVAQTPNDEPIARRLARSIEHNCVDRDETDEYHLSPRNTMRALLALNPVLISNVAEARAASLSPRNNRSSSNSSARPPSASLTGPHTASYHLSSHERHRHKRSEPSSRAARSAQ